MERRPGGSSRRPGARLGLGVEATVVALAGPTGAGKSSLFNALAGEELTAVGRRRPTTATAAAARVGRRPSRRRCSTGSTFRVATAPRRSDGARRASCCWTCPTSTRSSGAPAGGRPARRARRPRRLGRRPAEVRGCRLARRLPAPARGHARVDGRRPQPGRPARPAGARERAAPTSRGCSRRTASTRCRCSPSRRGRARGWRRARRCSPSASRRGRRRSRGWPADVGVAAAGLAASCGDRPAGGRGEATRDRLLDALADAAGVRDRPPRRRGRAPAARLAGHGLAVLPLAQAAATRPAAPPAAGDEPAENVAHVAAGARRRAGRRRGDRRPRARGRGRARHARAVAAARPRRGDLAELDRAPGRARPRGRRHAARNGAGRSGGGLAGALQTALAAAVAVGLLWLLALLALDYLGLEDVVPTPEARDIPLPTALALGGALAGILAGLLHGS